MEGVSLGLYIKVLRVQNGLSQVELSEKSGVCYTTINFIENDKVVPNDTTLIKLAKVLKTRPAELILLKRSKE